jgi:hypothetical protein
VPGELGRGRDALGHPLSEDVKTKIRSLVAEGVPRHVVADRLGVGRETITRHAGVAHVTHRPQDGPPLHRDSWRDFLLSLTSFSDDSPGRTKLFNRKPLGNGSQDRSYRRWAVEGATAGQFKADAFLIWARLHFQDYIDWCQENRRPVWAEGAPEWEL